MANGMDVAWEVEGVIQPDESIRDMLKVIAGKSEHDTGTFWCWDGRVREYKYILLLISELT